MWLMRGIRLCLLGRGRVCKSTKVSWERWVWLCMRHLVETSGYCSLDQDLYPIVCYLKS